MTAEWYLKNKTALAYDKTISKPILFLGARDGIYYYYDEFNNCKLQQKFKDTKLTKLEDNQKVDIIRKSLLNIDTNTSEEYKQYSN